MQFYTLLLLFLIISCNGQNKTTLLSPEPQDPKNEQKTISGANTSAPIGKRIRAILQDKAGHLWFATDGVCRYDPARGGLDHFDIDPGNAKHKDRSISDAVYCMFEDRSGNIWFGTPQKGVCRYDGTTFTYFTEKGLDRVIRGIFQDKNGNLWFGMNGGGVCRYDGTSFVNFSEEIGLSRNLSLSNLQDKSQQLNRVWTIAEDLSGNIWFGTVDEGVWRYDGVNMTNFTVINGLSSNTIWSILVDKAGHLWFGTEDGGVCKYDGRSFVNFTRKGTVQ
ncbi:MAG: two-component regulator propeller domain-containing protein [Saprospiraceae bacterium]|nr:two-component regulator propeller domain-containing protein [Saprospiraceae bacterium]